MLFNTNYIIYVQSLNGEQMGKSVLNLDRKADDPDVMSDRMITAVRTALADLAMPEDKERD